MIKRLFVLVFAACLLAGCSNSEKSQQPQEHIIALDPLSITLPAEFSPETAENDDQVFMYRQDQMYIYGYQESKQDVIAQIQQQNIHCEYISLGSYVQTFVETFVTEANPVPIDNYWSMEYTETMEGVQYTFLCVFYETDACFWRVMGRCPTESFEANRDYLQNILTSAQ